MEGKYLSKHDNTLHGTLESWQSFQLFKKSTESEKKKQTDVLQDKIVSMNL